MSNEAKKLTGMFVHIHLLPENVPSYRREAQTSTQRNHFQHLKPIQFPEI